MGFNSTVVVLNDALSSIDDDKYFGKKLADAVREAATVRPVVISAGGFCNAAMVVETHHADSLIPVLAGGNQGLALKVYIHREERDPELALLRALALKRGFTLQKDHE